MFTLHEIIRALTGQNITANDRIFMDASVDSREVSENTLFIAVPGENTDGHKFVPAAFAKGAPAALIQEDLSGDFAVLDLRSGNADVSALSVPEDRQIAIRVENTIEALQKTAAFHRRQLPGMEVAGITGTVGKTSTKEVIFDVLSSRYRTLKTPGNRNNEIGLPLTLLSADEKTEQAILEMGFYVPGEIEQLCGFALPSVGVVTNVGMVHASRAGSMEVIARGKAELVRALPSDGTAILNFDDPYVRPMAAETKARVFYYGTDPQAELYADHIDSRGLEGVSFDLNYHGEKHSIHTPLAGRHSVMTALRGAAVGLVKGLSWDEITETLKHCRNQLRMRITRAVSGGILIDDTYNASPESTTAALNLLAEMKGRKVAVLGEMRELGQYEQRGHEMVGERAAEVCDDLIAVGPVTRFIADAALAKGMPASRVHWFEEKPEALRFLQETFSSGDEVMLIKGSRGMMMEKIVFELEAKE